MASTPVSEIIFFIAALVISSMIAGVMITSIQETSIVFDQRSKSLAENIRDDITIINDPDNVANNPLIIYVKNTGDSSLAADKKVFDVLLNGTYNTNFSVASLDGDNELLPSDVAKLTINTTLPSGSHTIRVYVGGGEWDEMKFRI